jgi:hypothetical protein
VTDTYVVLLPGGRADSILTSQPWQLANLRMAWLQLALKRRVARGVDVRRVRYRVRGWNAPREDPVRDASAALDRLPGTARVILVGHSMERPGVVGVVALAPWWPTGEAGRIPAGTRLVVLHGTADTWTDPEASRRQADNAAKRGVDARWIPMAGGHFMIRRAAAWHRLTAEAIGAMLAADDGSVVER